MLSREAGRACIVRADDAKLLERPAAPPGMAMPDRSVGGDVDHLNVHALVLAPALLQIVGGDKLIIPFC
ncbi:hypothetical protein J8969_27505 [Klebsiella pneumoniae]|uniref:hypothetical protein n=1 Tax=Klebsiella pneumoniae TaxID=573 RepID=UPI002F9671D6